MSFLHFRYDQIKYGDTIFIYINPSKIFHEAVEKGKIVQTTFGALKLDHIVGRRYGQRFECSKGGYVYILQATPELWTICLPHRTQILYFVDISFIIINLDVTVGSIVGEAGTGSASMTHSLIRTVAPRGHVYTFDFHEKRVIQATEEFNRHGIKPFVTIKHRDVCRDGFPETLTNKLDAIFLDLPNPWETISLSKRSLKSGSRICCFSPCIEQVTKSVSTSKEHRFVNVKIFESLIRPIESVRELALKKLNLDVTTSNRRSNGESSNNNSNPKTDDEIVQYIISQPKETVTGHTGFFSPATKL